jgi:tetratricopeptide (TPR) repeat protein
MDAVKTFPKLGSNGFLGQLPEKRRNFLASRLKRVEFPNGTQIIKKGRSGQFIGFLESGSLLLENGRSQTRTIKAGGFFGDEMLRFGKPSKFTVTSQSDVVVWVLNRSDWQTPIPSSASGKGIFEKPWLGKKGWISLILVLSLALFIFTLGPSLLEYSNTTVPMRFVEEGRPDLAESYLRTVIHLQPGSALVYGELGDVLALQGKENDAMEVYQQALELDEYLPWIHNNLGVLLLENGEGELAIDHFLEAINLDPQNTEIYRNLGNAYYGQGDWIAAASAYQGALDLDSTQVDTKADWAGLNLYGSQLDDARAAWEEVLLEQPRHLKALQGLGVISLLNEDPEQAYLYLDAARFIDPDDLHTRLYLGMVLEALDMPAEAAAEYEFVVDSGSNPELSRLADTFLEVVAD